MSRRSGRAVQPVRDQAHRAESVPTGSVRTTITGSLGRGAVASPLARAALETLSPAPGAGAPSSPRGWPNTPR